MMAGDSAFLRLASLIRDRDQRTRTISTNIQRLHASEVSLALEALEIASRIASEELRAQRERDRETAVLAEAAMIKSRRDAAGQ
jgi:hypothetical protein